MKVFRKAILLIHGFAGGTYDFESLAKNLECINNYDVFTFTLNGHDGNSSEIIKYDMWIKKSMEEVEFLIEKGYKNIYVIGHSMGGVIASYLAYKYKEIKKVVLAAPAFRYIGHENDRFNYLTFVTKPYKLVKQYGGKIVINRLFKLPINCYLEFVRLVKEYQDYPLKLDKPILLIWGTSDNIVPKESIDYVYNSVKTNKKKIIYLEGISHDIFRESKSDIIIKEIINFLKNKSNYNSINL